MEANKVMEFAEKFFKNLGAKIIVNSEGLFISEVPADFEKFYGRKAPYQFVFSPQHKTPANELVEQGSYLLKAMSNFLDAQGKTTLVKINFKVDPEKELLKRIKLNNCEIEKLVSLKKHNFFFRFNFHTIFQYLNEKEKVTEDIYVYEGKIINGDLSDYELSEGRKSEVVIPDIKEPYEIAKEKMRELSKPKLVSLSEELSTRLDREIKRIEEHSITESKEVNEELNKKARKTGESIEDELFNRLADIKKDKLRTIELEKQRHGININTKLFNTTLIYYPLFSYDCFLSNKNGKRIIGISLDPLTNEFKELFCESCESKIKEIYLCTSGHVSCKNCFSRCTSCGKDHCKKCLDVECNQCGRMICKKCSTRCFSCSKNFCEDHMTKDRISGRLYCSNCLRICERCSSKKEPSTFKKSKKTGAEICGECFRKEMHDNIKGIFDN